ncbi:sentrin-specific protease 6 [Caerostris darwini]|uniref:Sentrin-specific protease 6 n=1 Tax=Caerostris darwini TaxID=1538125 RepID=A0AAV4WRH7_9ARAC|nr:sentrin-specific protease 6 [Caerostris darwini]
MTKSLNHMEKFRSTKVSVQNFSRNSSLSVINPYFKTCSCSNFVLIFSGKSGYPLNDLQVPPRLSPNPTTEDADLTNDILSLQLLQKEMYKKSATWCSNLTPGLTITPVNANLKGGPNSRPNAPKGPIPSTSAVTHCPSCNEISVNLNFCDSCNAKIPANSQQISVSADSFVYTKKTTSRPRTRRKFVEPVCYTLSSDDDDEEPAPYHPIFPQPQLFPVDSEGSKSEHSSTSEILQKK